MDRNLKQYRPSNIYFSSINGLPEEIEGLLRLEYGKAVISYQTSYRAIYKGYF